MGRYKESHATAQFPAPGSPGKSPGKTPLPAWKLWGFRMTALVVLPLLFVAILEMALHLAGFGQPTAFLLPAETAGQPVWIPTARFAWRFFGRNIAREPQAFSLARQEPANTIRILVLGESAAYGDPQPAFGLPRMWEAMLKLRFPDTRFEVVNAAMTASTRTHSRHRPRLRRCQRRRLGCLYGQQ